MSTRASALAASSNLSPTPSNAIDADPGVGFAARLRVATKLVHREAERTGFIADLIRGRATRGGYALLLRNLVPAYATLEQRLERFAAGGDVLLASFSAPGLRRLPCLVSDLETIAGTDWSLEHPLLPEAERYAGAIEAAAAGDASRLAAHAYARYLGDLSGGQILKPLLSRTLGLEPDALGFYDFPAFPDPDVAKQMLQEALETVDPSGPVADAIIEEAVAAFRHNIDLSLAVSRAIEATVG